MAQETGVQSQVESYQRLKKWYLIILCLTLSNIRYVSRVKWSNPRKWVVPSPIPLCSSYWKWSPRVTLDYVYHLYLLLYRYFSVFSCIENCYVEECANCDLCDLNTDLLPTNTSVETKGATKVHVTRNVGDHSQGWPKGSFLNSYYTEV